MDAGTFRKDSAPPPVSTDVVTLDQVITPFVDRMYKNRNVESWRNAASMLRRVSGFIVNDRRLGEWAMIAITEDVLETFESLSQVAAGTRTKYAATCTQVGRTSIDELCSSPPRKLVRGKRRGALDSDSDRLTAVLKMHRTRGVSPMVSR
jgi:hypothetical protein